MRSLLLALCSALPLGCLAGPGEPRRVDRPHIAPPPRALAMGLDRMDLTASPDWQLPRGAVRRIGPRPRPVATHPARRVSLGGNKVAVVNAPHTWGRLRTRVGPEATLNQRSALRSLVRVWDRPSGRLHWFLDAGSLGVAFDPLNKRVASQGTRYEVWDLEKQRRIWSAPVVGTRIWHTRRILLPPASHFVLVAGPGRTVRWYSPRTGRQLGTLALAANEPFVELLGLTADGRYLATRTPNTFHGAIEDTWSATRLWDLKTRKRVSMPGFEDDRDYIAGLSDGFAGWLVIDREQAPPARARRFFNLRTGKYRRLWGRTWHSRWLTPLPN